MLVSNARIRYIARILLALHGESAEAHTTMRVDRLLAVRDHEGAVMWHRVRQAIDELRTGHRPGRPLH